MKNTHVYQNFTNTFKGNNNKNTLILHNSVPFKEKGLNDYNTAVYPLLTENNKMSSSTSISLSKPENLGLSKYMRDYFGESLGKSNTRFKRHVRSPLDNKITLDTLKVLNKPKPPFEAMELVFNDYYKEKHKDEVDRYQYYKEQKDYYEDLDINEISNHKIISQLKENSNKNIEFPIPEQMRKEYYPKRKKLLPDIYSKEQKDDLNKTDSEEEFKEQNINQINKAHPHYKELIENPVQGEPVGIPPKCKECKYIKPIDVVRMVQEERDNNERRIQGFMDKVNKSVENMMTRLEILTNRVLQRESNILKYHENKMKVRPGEFNSGEQNLSSKIPGGNLEKPPRTPIPILTEIVKPKKYYRLWSKWKIIKRVAQFSLFYFVLLRYAAHRSIRESVLLTREKTKESDFEIIKFFMIGQMKRLFEEFKIAKGKNFSIATDKETDTLYTLENFQIITSFIRTFFKCLIENTMKVGISKLPKNIIYVLYTYIVDNFYYEKNFLTSFELYRLEFNLMGEVINLNKARRGMILAFLLINKVFVQQVLLKPSETFVGQLDAKVVYNFKYFGSLIHYMVRDAFRYNPIYFKDRINLSNYYRNYHLDDYTRFETAMDKLDSDLDSGQLFDDERNLCPEEDVDSYFKLNILFKKQFEEDIWNWATELGENITYLWSNRKEFIKLEDILNMAAKKRIFPQTRKIQQDS